ncbi:DUF721 domain-containing protein [Luteibaculum oceani]|uniref:DUF721 domain-containing protein n=1 Tax=Luteibaculum oceani TaxID=1294296 RepID=UPI001476AE84|nr:DUF721 domain-containing protein [Luteibaculum oceani]
MSIKRQNSEPLGAVIKRLLKAYRLNDKYYKVAIEEEWKQLMGPLITKHTESIYYKEGKLVIKLSSAVLRQELSFGKEKIMRSINKALGEPIIKTVELR